MNKIDGDKFLNDIENKLLNNSERIKISLNRDWANSFPNEPAVYIFFENNEICYVGETGNIRGRMNEMLNTKNHNFRRNYGNIHFNNFENYEKPSSRKSFSNDIEILLNEKINVDLTMSYIVLWLGRKELEEKLIEKFKPNYCLKGKRGTGKTYTKFEKQLKHKNAYEKWTVEEDEKLKNLFYNGTKIKDLSEIFMRNIGAIRSRIKKLGIKK